MLNKNIKNLKCEENCNVVNSDCFNFIENLENNKLKFDIIFLDPPYKEKKNKLPNRKNF